MNSTNRYGIVFYHYANESTDEGYEEIRFMFTCDNYFSAEDLAVKYNKKGWHKIGVFYVEENNLEFYTEDVSVLDEEN